MFRNIRTYLGSLRFTITLILSLGVIFLLGLWIPQKGLIDYEGYVQWKQRMPSLVAVVEYLGLMEIYRAPITLILWALFFINLSLVMWQRVPAVRRRVALPAELPDPEGGGFSCRAAFELPAGFDCAELLQRLGAAGYVCRGDDAHFHGIRNRLAPVASLLFHLSFFLILLGGVISVYTRFVGSVDLAEGEEFRGEIERYQGKPLIPKLGSPPRMRIVVRQVTPMVQGQTPTGLKVTLEDGRSQLHNLDINRPYKEGNLSLVLKDLGLAPLFVLQDTGGRELDGAFVKLNVLRGKEDGFRMGGKEFRVRFFPDHQMVNGEDTSRSEEFRNPMLAVMTLSGTNRSITRIPYAAGARIPLGDMNLVLVKQAYWVRFTVVSEEGVMLIYTGFLLACAGLLWRLGFYRREVAGSVRPSADGGSHLVLAFRSEFYRALAEEEFDTLQLRLKLPAETKRGHHE